ncbi:MAG TPA: peptide deformylase [Trueperaceae bacterium]
MIHPIVLYGDPVLRRRASPVTEFGPELQRLAEDMIETMYAADGVGLAAPQIGLPWRMFVALEIGAQGDEEAREGQVMDDEDAGPLTQDQKRRSWGVVAEHVVVNPTITLSKDLQFGRDGCLSLPGLSVEEVPRALSVTLDYQDVHGEKRRLEAEGYFAHVLQHEFDHLEGVLFFDHLPADRRELFLEENRATLAGWQREARAAAKERNTGKLLRAVPSRG